MEISLQTARRMALNAQLLGGRNRLPEGKEGVALVIEKLGYVQIDTISVIQRAHHHTLWTRCPDYTQEMLHELQARDRRVFEYWGHAASYLPMCDYRYYIPKMRYFDDPKQKWEKQRLDKFGHLMKPVLERIRKEGPLGSKDFIPKSEKKRGTWWDWRPSKVALELLFWKGDLMITERRNFSRIYDLTERVLPEGIDTSAPDDDELGRFLVRRALAAYGIAKENEIREHIHTTDKEMISESLHDLMDAGEVVSLKIGKSNSNNYYALSDLLERSSKLKKKSPQLRLLSPFDNLIIQRERIKNLFGFDYALECYVPASKRQYGYFVLPILWGEQFAGRLDPKSDRKKKILIIQKLFIEEGFYSDDTFLQALAQKLRGLAQFNECEKITVQKTDPASLKSKLLQLLKK